MTAGSFIAAGFLGVFLGGTPPATDRTPLTLNLVVPGSDSTTSLVSRHRLAGSTSPGARVRVNGKRLRVYPTGAFAHLLELDVGENVFTVTAVDPGGDSLARRIFIRREEPLATSRADTLLIEDAMMEPSVDQWVREKDILRVQFKGTPGCQATFLDSIPMREVPPGRARGVRGVYRGVYQIGAGDSLKDDPIRFRLEDSLGNSIGRESAGRVTCIEGWIPITGVTIGDRPYLNCGLGRDRLGGTKLAYIVPGVRLSLTGKVGRQYRVALAEGMDAWIPERMVELEPPGTYPPFSLTGSWSVSGEEKFDEVAIGLQEKLPYSSYQELNPTRIVVDVYGAVPNTNWITHHSTGGEVTNVHYRQAGTNTFRITLELAHRHLWGYTIGYEETRLVIRVRRQPVSLDIEDLTIALDAGHGGEHEGALGSTGAMEKDVNLATVLHLKEELEDRGARVILTRSSDSTLSITDRLNGILTSDADILLSVHANSIGVSTDPQAVQGVSTYYKHICYRPLSVHILDEVLKTGLRRFGNVGSFNFRLNSPTEMPNALVELAFMSHPEDEMKLLDDGFRRELAERIADGIERFLEECEE
ncbi:MAG: N-acetylmuramoyl-L-alanine amidase [Bacteroidota bacterium]